MSGVDVKCRLNPGEVKVLERRGRDALYRELKHDAALEAEAVSALGQEARRADIANFKRQRCFVQFRQLPRPEQEMAQESSSSTSSSSSESG